MLNRKLCSGLKIVSAVMLLVISGQGFATSAAVTTYVNRVLMTSDASYGGCMAMIAATPAGLTGCTAGWVSFDCAGTFSPDTARAYRMVDQAQLALTTDRQVYIVMDDSKKFTVGTSNYCTASRIDVISR